MKKLIYLFFLTLGTFSCSSDDESEISNLDLVGLWNWTGTSGGLVYHEETPESTGKTIHLILKDNYDFSIIENGNEISSGTYILSLKKSIYSEKTERFIQFPENLQYTGIVNRGIIKTYETKMLNISDNNYDGIRSGFTKIE